MSDEVEIRTLAINGNPLSELNMFNEQKEEDHAER